MVVRSSPPSSSSYSFNKVLILLSSPGLLLLVILIVIGEQQKLHHQCDAFVFSGGGTGADTDAKRSTSTSSISISKLRPNQKWASRFQCSSSLSPSSSSAATAATAVTTAATTVTYTKASLIKLYQSSQDDSQADGEDDVNQIRDMILSISLETDDEKRRGRVTSLLQEKLNQKDVNDSARFAHLWDTTLIQVGGEIQNQARIDAENEAKLNESNESNGLNGSNESSPVSPSATTVDDSRGEGQEEGDGDSSSTTGTRTKSAVELQLWSMVDMMVQSKSLIKKLMNE